MSDTDRILSSIKAQRPLADACTSCAYSKVYCHCVTYLDGADVRCCPDCSH